MFAIYDRSFLETFMVTWSCKKLATWLSFWSAVYKFLKVLFHEVIKRTHDVRIMLITIYLNTFMLLILIILGCGDVLPLFCHMYIMNDPWYSTSSIQNLNKLLTKGLKALVTSYQIGATIHSSVFTRWSQGQRKDCPSKMVMKNSNHVPVWLKTFSRFITLLLPFKLICDLFSSMEQNAVLNIQCIFLRHICSPIMYYPSIMTALTETNKYITENKDNISMARQQDIN